MLLIAGGAAVAAAVGGLLLDDGVEDVEMAVQTGNLPGLNLSTAPLDEKTKLALKVAVALFALVGVSIGERGERVAYNIACILRCFHTGPCPCKASNTCEGLPSCHKWEGIAAGTQAAANAMVNTHFKLAQNILQPHASLRRDG